MIEVKPLKAEDILWVIEHGVKEVGLRATPTEEMREMAEAREKSGAVTGWVDGEIFAVGGIDKIWSGVGSIWLMVTPFIDTHVKDCYKCILKGINKMIKEQGIRRLEAFGRVDFPECHTLFKHLGFKVEGLAEARTPDGVDCIMYARIE